VEGVPQRLEVTSDQYAARVNEVWGASGSVAIRSWWQSPVILREINRRITGNPDVRPQAYFAARYCKEPLGPAVSLGSGGGELELELVQLEACTSMLGLELAEERVAGARDRTPAELRDRVTFQRANLETWSPPPGLGLVVARDVLHHIEGLERLFAELAGALRPDGLFYVDEFVGPARFQWTDKQLELITRLFGRLAPELRVDLTGEETVREVATRPDLEAFIASDPSEAIRSDEIPELLERFFEPVEVKPYGGAIYQQLFNRIMGNFADRDDLVRTIVELDFILTDEGVVGSDYLWGVYRPR
jgi:SAM-dependent methyltransferase